MCVRRETVQGETLSLEDARDLVEFCNSSTSESKAKAKGSKVRRDEHSPMDAQSGEEFLVSYAMFCNVMSNFTKASLFDQTKLVEYQDMTHPLSFYYMASSHNTYLEGDQLTSFSSVNRYVNDLLLGCRCVELDCWDGDNGQPIICHGHTMTGKILFKDVIRAIAEYGFVTSPYPVVLSIENHCCLDQQKTLAKIMLDVLKDKLAMPVRHADGSPVTTLPSPMELKHKVCFLLSARVFVPLVVCYSLYFEMLSFLSCTCLQQFVGITILTISHDFLNQLTATHRC